MSYNFTNENVNNPWFPSSRGRSAVGRAGRGLSSTLRSGASGWSSAQIFLAVTVGLVAISAGMAGYAGLIVSSITTFNLNNFYYGRIGELSNAILNTDSPLFVNTTTDPAVIYLTCSGSQSNLCSYVAYLNTSITALQNITQPNVTLPSLAYTNGAAFMFNVSNGKAALDNLVGEALYLQSQIDNLVAANGSATLSTLTYTNGASFMTNVTNGKQALDNLVGESLVQTGQITTLQGQTVQLLATKNRNYYVSASYGNDATCDASASLPCLTLYRTLQLIPNTTSQFAQNTVVFDNGLYSESNFISLKPNLILAGNEIGTLLIFAAGAGLDGGSWIATGTGFVSFLRFGLIRCTSACTFDMATDAPATSIFSVFRFYNSTLDLNTAGMSFRRRADASSYFSVVMESVTSTGTSITFQDMTSVTWDLSGDVYSAINLYYNTSTTYAAGTPLVNVNGLVAHSNVVLNNYVSGLLVDWSLMDVILRDSATLTRNYVSGASINVHGDVLSLGSINGGLLSTGSGSGTTQYLTNDYGLGTAQDTPSDWDLPYPTDQHETNTQLASRLRDIENTPQRRFYITFTANTTTSVSIPLNVSVVYFTACGGGSSGVGANPGSGDGGNAGAGIVDLPIINRGVNFVVTVGLGGASGATSNSGGDTTITNSLEMITLEGGQSVGGLNRGGHVILTNSPSFDTPTVDTIVSGTAGSGAPGGASVVSGYMYGGAGGGAARPNAFPGYSGGYTSMLSERSSGSAGGSGGNTNGGGGGSSILGIGGSGGSGSGDNNGSAGGLCAGGGGAGNTNLISATNGGAGGNGDAYLYYYIV